MCYFNLTGTCHNVFFCLGQISDKMITMRAGDRLSEGPIQRISQDHAAVTGDP